MSQPLDPTRASSAETALRDGRLEDALEALQADIRKKPQDKALRVFLFQLLVVTGAWERALRQLNVLVEMDAQYALLAQAYRPLIACEVFRGELFQGARSPSSLGEPLPWFDALCEAARLTATGQHAAAQALRTKAFDEAERYYQRAMALEPANVLYRSNYADMLCSTGKIEEGLRQHATILKDSPDRLRSHLALNLTLRGVYASAQDLPVCHSWNAIL